MDTVTESAMAIALAQEGCIGVMHKNMPIDDQQNHVRTVKRAMSGMILDPITVYEDSPMSLVQEIIDKYGISGVVVVDKKQRLKGILTNRDIIFEKKTHQEGEGNHDPRKADYCATGYES
jgi:IMP dehydrogenase